MDDMALDWTNEAMARGLACYRNGHFFEAHEHWEAVWLALPEPDKTFLQCLIQISAAMHHASRGTFTGAASLLKRVLTRLKPYPPRYADVNVSRLRGELMAWIEALDVGSSTPAAPTIL